MRQGVLTPLSAALFELLAGSVIVPEDKGSFDCVAASLREATPSLRMTISGIWLVSKRFASATNLLSSFL
jgi:hypothetical protein